MIFYSVFSILPILTFFSSMLSCKFSGGPTISSGAIYDSLLNSSRLVTPSWNKFIWNRYSFRIFLALILCAFLAWYTANIFLAFVRTYVTFALIIYLSSRYFMIYSNIPSIFRSYFSLSLSKITSIYLSFSYSSILTFTALFFYINFFVYFKYFRYVSANCLLIVCCYLISSGFLSLLALRGSDPILWAVFWISYLISSILRRFVCRSFSMLVFLHAKYPFRCWSTVISLSICEIILRLSSSFSLSISSNYRKLFRFFLR